MLKPGMVARVRLARGEAREALLVPREAVLRTETGYIGVRRARAGRPSARRGGAGRDRLGGRQPRRDRVGPGAGDRVVVVGQHQVADGDVVEIVRTGGAMSESGRRTFRADRPRDPEPDQHRRPGLHHRAAGDRRT
jgi:membrane fusion protein, multidrug efflux system